MRLINPVHIKRDLTFIIILLTLTSCKLLESSIINNCSSDVNINLQYGEELIDNIPSGKDGFYKWIDKSTKDTKTEMISFDSTNFIASYLLNRSDTFFIKPAVKFWGDTIPFIKEISFIKNQDTLTIGDWDLYDFIFFNDSSKYNPFKLEDYYFELDE